MKAPNGPLYCDVCKKDSMQMTQIGDKKAGLFTLSTHKIGGKEFRLHPQTALCQYCGQVKLFVESLDE